MSSTHIGNQTDKYNMPFLIIFIFTYVHLFTLDTPMQLTPNSLTVKLDSDGVHVQMSFR